MAEKQHSTQSPTLSSKRNSLKENNSKVKNVFIKGKKICAIIINLKMNIGASMFHIPCSSIFMENVLPKIKHFSGSVMRSNFFAKSFELNGCNATDMIGCEYCNSVYHPILKN